MKGIPRIFTKEDAILINEIRQQNPGIITYRKLVEILRPLGNTVALIERFSKCTSPIIIKVGVGKYKFQDNPIYFDKMNNAWKEDQKKEKDKKKPSEIEEAIELLKKKGFKVLRQDFDLDGALENPDLPVSRFIEWTEL